MERFRAPWFAATAALLGLVVAPRPGAALELQDVLHQVAAENPMLAARAAMVEAARRRVGPAGAWPAPMVELGVVNVPTTAQFNVDPMTMKMVGVMQTVPVFGANGLARRSARAALDAELAGAERTAWETLGMAWEAYANAAIATERVTLVSEHRRIAGQVVQSARARYQNGQGRLEDVLRSQAEQGMLEADLAMFRAKAAAARARLNALRGVSIVSADSLAPMPDVRIPATAEPWLDAVAAAHPRVREQAKQVERYRLAAGAARRRLWPDLELRYAYGFREEIAHAVHEQYNMVSASVAFALPVFGSARSEALEMDAMARASAAEARAAELDLAAQVLAAHAEAAGAQWRAALLADTVIVMQRRALEASWSAYRAGSSDMWRVFESSHALYGEEVELLRVRQELAHACARLVGLTGRTELLGVTASPRSHR